MTVGVTERAKEVGLNYDFSNLMEENTLKAHRLVKWAEQQGDVTALVESLLNSHFIEGKRIGQDDVLLEIAEKVGLEREEVAKVLADDGYKNEVEADIQEGLQVYEGYRSLS